MKQGFIEVPIKVPVGPEGPTGVGIKKITQNNFDIEFLLTNNESFVIKNLRGKEGPPGKGEKGSPGATGVGIKSLSQDNFDVIIELTDGSKYRLKNLRGPQGPIGPASVIPGPQGPKGEPGAPGKDAPTSKYKSIVTIQGSTTVEETFKTLKFIPVEEDDYLRVYLDVGAKGVNQNNFADIERKYIIYRTPGKQPEILKIKATNAPFKTNNALECKLEPVAGGININAYGVDSEEVIWTGEIEIKRT